MLRLISVLWRIWRSHIRIEFAILSEQLVIRVLQASATKIKPEFKMIALEEVAIILCSAFNINVIFLSVSISLLDR